MTPLHLFLLACLLCAVALGLAMFGRAPKASDRLTFLALVVLALGFLVGVSA